MLRDAKVRGDNRVELRHRLLCRVTVREQPIGRKMYKRVGISGISHLKHQRLKMLCLQIALCLLAGALLVSTQATSSQQAPTTTTPPTTTITTSSHQATQVNQTVAPEPLLPLNNNSSQLQSQVAAKPVLRPSLEVEASALSRRYLNLVHESRRIRPVSPPQPQVSPQSSDTREAVVSTPDETTDTDKGLLTHGRIPEQPTKQTVEAEQEITQSSPLKDVTASSDLASSGTPSSSPLPSAVDSGSNSFFRGPSNETQPLQILPVKSEPQPVVEGVEAAQVAEKKPTGRRKKSGFSNVSHQVGELQQCHQYLQRHSWHGSMSSSSLGPLTLDYGSNSGESLAARLLTSNNQLLPCTCSKRSDLHLNQQETSLWLSCDHVQLMGSHFYSPNIESLETSDDAAGRKSPLLILRFSQRDAGLQTLHSQKFHYLQLFFLKSIDLSHNRIRLIKMDAFHGIENQVEQLDLSNNLLGDSRGAQTGNDEVVNKKRKQETNQQKLIFSSDELVRLRRVKWLSLHNNQISLLSSSIFIKSNQETSQGMHELSYLDLSENLLKLVPSESIQLLDKLRTLKLNRNRIGRLDEDSKFPKSLVHLDLSENSIRTIRHCNLIELSELMEINLSHNQLSQLDKSAFISSASSLAADLLLTTSVAGAHLHRDGSEVSQVLHETGGNRNLLAGASADHSSLTTSRRRKRRDLMSLLSEPPLMSKTGEPTLATGGETGGGERAEEEELVADESILSSITNLVTGRKSGESNTGSKQQVEQEESLAQMHLRLNQFNSTLKLNLSYNFFQTLPGDSLVKFVSLQQLDLSYNRIRRLDSNYLCSLYNLVENLRELDLSGNLLSVPAGPQHANSTTTTTETSGSSKHQLNKVFGCLQRLEKLSLSSNRLNNQAKTISLPLPETPDVSVNKEPDLADTLLTDADENGNTWLTADGQSVNIAASSPVTVDDDRLVIRFGEGYASKHLNHLDLSDNQLRKAPLFEYIPQQHHLGPSNVTSSGQTWHMNQWLSSRVCIQVLDLSYNYIERLEERDLEHLRNIRQLRLDYNRLLDLPAKLIHKFTSLDLISLEGNKLSSLEPLNELFEKSTRTLRVLNLAYNRLSQWPTNMAATRHSTPVASDSSMAEQQSSLAVSPPATFVLEELNLEGNLLTSDNVTGLFEQLNYMRSLRLLRLSQNLLHRVKSEWFKFSNGNLRELVLTANRINTIDLGSFTRDQVNELTSLSLDYNLLRELKRKTFDSMPKIRELNLGNNFIHTINSETFYQINTLQILKLNNNKLSSWRCEYFSHLCNTVSGTINADLLSLVTDSSSSQTRVTSNGQVSSLIELDLSHNSLSQLRVNSISVHTRLERLNLSHNKLSFIPHDLFRASASGGTNGRQVQLVSSLKYLNLANNHIQTVDNINFKPLRNLMTLDLSFNEIQTIGSDVVIVDGTSSRRTTNDDKKIVINSNQQHASSFTDSLPNSHDNPKDDTKKSSRSSRSLTGTTTNWPALVKLRYLNVAHNQLTAINQSLISELSPFALLNLNLSSNLIDSEALPFSFYTKISGAHFMKVQEIASQTTINNDTQNQKQPSTANYYDLVFNLKLESLDLSHNRLHEFPAQLLDNHYTSMEICNLAHNRIQNFLADSSLMIQIKSLNLEFNPLNRESNELILFEQKNVRKLNLAATRLFAIHKATKELEVPSGVSQHNSTSPQLDLIRSINKPINAPYLRELNLSSNQLVWLAANVFDQLHSLKVLDLSNNQLTRLHLLNNQLMPAAPTLEYLNLASNLYTSIDQGDLNQLSTLKHLDLSNLMSLQRMNCRFLSKLSGLKVLRLINYPQLRNNLESLISNLKSINRENLFANEKMRRKMRNELILSTLGKHCFEENHLSLGSSKSQDRCYDLEELQLELFNDFTGIVDFSSFTGEFLLDNQIQSLLGPNTRKLILVGTNLTELGVDSLSGILSNELELKISYTSLYKVPLDQIYSGLSKRTKFDLDFRNNNIQLIEAKGLQLLDEFQLQNRLLEREDHSVLSLASNPIRCDCQARPLWLWLNQRWSLVDQLQMNTQSKVDQEASGETVAQPTYWMKFKGLARTSDLKCYYPTGLRGKLTQHVFYNDLICHEDIQPIVVNRQSRRRINETISGAYDGDDVEVDELLESFEQPLRSTRVVMTKFNRYNQHQSQNSQQVMVRNEEELSPRQAQTQTKESSYELAERSKKGKRDHAGTNLRGKHLSSSASSQQSSDAAQQQQVHSVSQYWRQPLSAFNAIGSQLVGPQKPSTSRRTWLTDIDVFILTGISIAMAFLSLIIISVCLLKHRLDKSDERQQMLGVDSAGVSFVKALSTTSGGNGSATNGRLRTSKGSSGGSSVGSSKQSSKSSAKNSPHQTATSTGNSRCPPAAPSSNNEGLKPVKRQVLVPIVNRTALAPTNASNSSQLHRPNFLMRSPTIKRMHGLANNASDWFKFTLSKPAANLKQRGQLFRGAHYSMAQQHRTPVATVTTAASKFAGHRLLSLPEFVGCPVHEFACVQKLGNTTGATGVQKPLDEQCAHCQRLLAAMDGRHFMLSPAASSLSEAGASGVEKPLVPRPQVAPKPSQVKKFAQEAARLNGNTAQQQVKVMRTFGSAATQQQQQQHQQQQSKASELPSEAVEGRFAYQPESQLASPGSSLQSAHPPTIGRIAVQWPPSSDKGPTTDNDGNVFILVEEEGDERRLKFIKRTAEGSMEMSEDDDECSNSSSPVAYGFMRSSSSIATTISSTPLRQKYVPEYATSTKKSAHLYSALAMKSTSSIADDNNNNNNNEQVTSKIHRNTGELLEQVMSTREKSGHQDEDQTIIISRL